ncbi:hypothetical protein [Ralstonia sp. UBA689]|uniref:hypothetical protein n=1 Tax=Ralstonia sp. UBA689 TaxID=1947373 RepID=UPI0025FAFA41|nr:hypothetical protein [Ralstonia sp. UBA689]
MALTPIDLSAERSGTGHVLLLRQLLGLRLSLWLSDAWIGSGLSPLAVLEHGDEFIRRRQSVVPPGFHGLDVYEKTVE